MDFNPLNSKVYLVDPYRVHRWIKKLPSPPLKLQLNGSGDTTELDSSTIPTSEVESEFIDEDFQVVIGLVNTTETFSFSLSYLEKRGCKDLLELIQQKSGTPIILGEDTAMNSHRIYTNASSSPAMKLFQEWVLNGQLRPVLKHHSGPILDYYILYMIAYHLGHRHLCIAALNETRAWTYETGYAPSLNMTRQLRRVFGGEMPIQLTHALAFCRGVVCLYYDGVL